ncbi:ImmA/IrrE family metallo-endopeptidase [Sphingomonas panni]|uniref:ImmA/IrrE family metallo-endopeptidase n=1 Tax=Sphingomonas panni TaxID=237612 RepID=UPI0030199D31
MADDKKSLIDSLRKAGLSAAAITAAWPSWWTEEAEESPSGRAELRFALARRLGLEPRPLLGERVEFVWNDEAKFKHLNAQDEAQRAALTSFGMSIGRLLLRATPAQVTAAAPADILREAILVGNAYVDLNSLVATCWTLGIPVIYLRVFPLDTKSMHAMVVRSDGRFAILLGRDATYPAPVAFTLAHELGHAMLGHLDGAPALIDLEDPALAHDGDDQEDEADRFALTLLTGSPDPDIQTNLDRFNAPTLARAVLDVARQYRIEPGTLALCVAHRTRAWPVAMSALKFIYAEPKPAWREVNGIADRMIVWDDLGDDAALYLRNVMIGGDA